MKITYLFINIITLLPIMLPIYPSQGQGVFSRFSPTPFNLDKSVFYRPLMQKSNPKIGK